MREFEPTPEYFCPAADKDVVAEGRMAFMALFVAGAAEGDSLVKGDVFTDDRRLADNDAGAVVDKKPFAYLCRGMDLYPRPPAHDQRDKARQHGDAPARVKVVDAAVRGYREKTRRTEYHLKKTAESRGNRRIIPPRSRIVTLYVSPYPHSNSLPDDKKGPVSRQALWYIYNLYKVERYSPAALCVQPRRPYGFWMKNRTATT